MSNQVVSTGRAKTSATTGSVVNLVPRGCQVLGFYANATTTIAIYDEGAGPAGAAADLQVNITACAVGWNPLPIELINGLSVNQGAQVYFVIQ
jgi:hypothetical protein